VTAQDGLTGSTVTALLEDRQGTVWLGTDRGLIRWDGQARPVTERAGPGANLVTSLIEARDGAVWAAVPGVGACRYDGSGFSRLTRADGLVDESVASLAEDPRGGIWLAGIAWLGRYEGPPVRRFLRTAGLPGTRFQQQIQVDPAGMLWIATSDGALAYDGRTWQVYTTRHGLSNTAVMAVAWDGQGRTWLGTEAGLDRYQPGQTKPFAPELGVAAGSVRAILPDREGNLWLGTDGGLIGYDGESLRTFTSRDGLGHDRVYAILEDRQGNLWFRTGEEHYWQVASGVVGEGGGVSRYDGSTFTRFTTADGLSPVLGRAMLQDRQGRIWVGPSRWEGDRFTTFTWAEGLVRPGGFWLDPAGMVWALQGWGRTARDALSRLASMSTRKPELTEDAIGRALAPGGLAPAQATDVSH
jgi:ligand-binding sensor domain-containing protein